MFLKIKLPGKRFTFSGDSDGSGGDGVLSAGVAA